MPHIIKPDQCKIKYIKKYEKNEIKFNHQNLSAEQAINFLGKVILEALRKIVVQTSEHAGIIIFIQSYKLIANIKKVL